MLKKLWSPVSEAVDSAVDNMSGFLLKKYPDIDEVLDVITAMKLTCGGDGGDCDDGDKKWRPMLITLGLLYKLQRIHDSSPSSWYNNPEIFIHDDGVEERLMHVFGFYWHYCMKIAGALRTIDNTEGVGSDATCDGPVDAKECEVTVNNIIASTGLDRNAVLYANATDQYHVGQHCPDFAMIVLHELQQILIVICGTRMIPAPKMKDVFMDLQADAVQFLHGNAHMGMAHGSNNIAERVMPKLLETLAEHPDYNIMVIGYSLGAGICQLLTMDLLEGEPASRLPTGTAIRCISYGAPPVFRSELPEYKCPNVFNVVYNNDGLASASVASVTKLFLQIKAVDRLQLRRRDMIKMLWNRIPTAEGTELKDSNDDEDDDFDNKMGSTRSPLVLEEASDWTRIQRAVDAVQDVGIVQLEHPAKNLFLFKRKQDQIITRRLQNTRPLSDHLRLRGAMLNNHMPWGYDELFRDYGTEVERVDISILSVANDKAASLYPDLSQL